MTEPKKPEANDGSSPELTDRELFLFDLCREIGCPHPDFLTNMLAHGRLTVGLRTTPGVRSVTFGRICEWHASRVQSIKRIKAEVTREGLHAFLQKATLAR